jgi:hypothetical protein
MGKILGHRWAVVARQTAGEDLIMRLCEEAWEANAYAADLAERGIVARHRLRVVPVEIVEEG